MTPRLRLYALAVEYGYHLRYDDGWWAWPAACRTIGPRIPSWAIWLGRGCPEALVELAIEIGEAEAEAEQPGSAA
jgi:hypothetical protein